MSYKNLISILKKNDNIKKFILTNIKYTILEIKDIEENQFLSKKELSYPSIILQINEDIYTANSFFINKKDTIDYRNIKKLNIANSKQIRGSLDKYVGEEQSVKIKRFDLNEGKILDWLNTERENIKNAIDEEFNILLSLIYKQKTNEIVAKNNYINSIIYKNDLTCEISIFTRKTYRFYNNKNVKLFSSISNDISNNLIKSNETMQTKELKGKYVLKNDVVIQLIDIILESLSGEKVLSGQSVFNATSLNKQILNSKFNIFQKVSNTLELDDEGTPILDVYLIKDGTVKDYMLTLEQSIILNKKAYGNSIVNQEGKYIARHNSIIVATEIIDESCENLIVEIKVLGINFQNMNISMIAYHAVDGERYISNIITLNVIEFFNSAKEIQGTKSKISNVLLGDFIYEF